MSSDSLGKIATLLHRRNTIDAEIARIIDRPMTSGHLGEWIASKVFDIELEQSASATAIDGRFRTGPLAGKTVNVKWYLKREGVLEVSMSTIVDYYLVMTGPKSWTVSTRGGTRPWVIEAVYLFGASQLQAELVERGVKIGVATSVRNAQWLAAEVFPAKTNQVLVATPSQVEQLRQFAASRRPDRAV